MSEMNYSNLSDFDINKLVAKSLGSVDVRQLKNMINEVYCEINGVRCFKDFCNNPADAWPIILENGICLKSPIKGSRNKFWSASRNKDGGSWSVGDIYHSNENPLRAAMIVFLMMNE